MHFLKEVFLSLLVIQMQCKSMGQTEEEQVIQPEFRALPNPYPLSKSQPEILVFRKGRSKVDITYDVTPENGINLMISNDLLATSRVVFITHGFRSDKNTEWLHIMKDKMVAERDQTVVIVGWGKGSDIGLLNYEQASANCLSIGEWLSPYLNEIRRRSPNTIIWGVGHSLGAHLMGAAGRASRVMDRITGLDPAGVGFQSENLDKRLTRTDAKLVDVIHSDGKAVPYYGTLIPLGTLDFYPNFGWAQPTYDSEDKKPYMISTESQPKGPVSHWGSGFSESHSRAIDYFIWSIDNKNKFRTKLVLDGSPQKEKAVHRLRKVFVETEMGYYADQYDNNYGTDTYYYIHTNAAEPWI